MIAMVPAARLELARPLQTLDFESNASTDSTTRAYVSFETRKNYRRRLSLFQYQVFESSVISVSFSYLNLDFL